MPRKAAEIEGIQTREQMGVDYLRILPPSSLPALTHLLLIPAGSLLQLQTSDLCVDVTDIVGASGTAGWILQLAGVRKASSFLRPSLLGRKQKKSIEQ